MALLPIVTGKDTPILRQKTQEIESITKEIGKLISDMKDTAKRKGLGLAAPQINQSIRLCVARVNGRYIAFLNPYITWRNEETDIQEEGCLSLPDEYYNITRPISIVVEYMDEQGSRQERKLSGMDARVVQHEVDHLEGILITDYIGKDPIETVQSEESVQ